MREGYDGFAMGPRLSGREKNTAPSPAGWDDGGRRRVISGL